MTHEAVVLIVDDKEMFDYMAPVVKESLHTAQLIHCDNFNDAMVMIRSDLAIDFIFADWELSGPDFIREVRHDAETHHSPLIIMSTSDDEQFIGMVMRLGATDVLTKPFMEKGLTHKIQRVVHSRDLRLRRRLKVDMCDGTLSAAFTNGELVELKLVDLSILGARARGPHSLCGKVCINQEVALTLGYCVEPVELAGRLIRLEYDPEEPETNVLLAFRFEERDESEKQRLREVMEELRDAQEGGVRVD